MIISKMIVLDENPSGSAFFDCYLVYYYVQ